MQYITVRNMEKYHPGYKDRTMTWAKIFVNMVQGDPEFEMIESETDKWRYVAIILLELSSKKPLPDIPKYWASKGFDLKKRPMSLTIQMLHNFITTVTEEGEQAYPRVEKSRVEESRVDSVFSFDSIWDKYPNKDGRKLAQKFFETSVTTEQDLLDINTALKNYLGHLKANDWKRPKNGSTWFNNWKDWVKWIEPEEPEEKKEKVTGRTAPGAEETDKYLESLT